MEAMAHETDDKNDDLPSYKMVPVQKLYQKIILWNQAQLKSSASQVAAGEVEIQGGIYDLETGHVEFLGQSPAQEPRMEIFIGQ